MTAPRIAILSVACRLPEAETADELWQNVLEGRRAFRPIPPERLELADYDAKLIGAADSIPRIPAGLLSDWIFSRSDFCIPRATFESTDLTHWLALDVTAEAIEAIGGVEILPRERTAVILGDTLTGEFTRSAQLRFRAPYLNRRLSAILSKHAIDVKTAAEITTGFMGAVTADFPDPNEETLAGALANTIAGRIANHFDLNGGAWTVDGACASSLLAVSDACGRLSAGDMDAAIVGGVDLSLDPFELVGFARAGALALDEMRVFDRRSAGFWPGEGCGIAVLATEDFARRIEAEPIAWIHGWGVSTDGSGGLTRPTISGQSLALKRAWARAGMVPETAGLFEAHGTGTAVGDSTEIRALAGFLGNKACEVPVGSIKANIGHCKAAAGMAGLIKVISALRNAIVPPHVGCEEPHPVFGETGNALAPAKLRDWRGVRRAGVSGFGFGGVNAHVVLASNSENDTTLSNVAHSVSKLAQPRPQGAELFVFAANEQSELVRQLRALRTRAPTLSLSEITDAAAAAAHDANHEGAYRASVVADRVETLIDGLNSEMGRLASAPEQGIVEPRIGFLFPGQAAPVRGGGGIWTQRFAEDVIQRDQLPQDLFETEVATEFAQPAIVADSMMGLQVLNRLGLHAAAAVGHSLGELTALAWAEVLSGSDCCALAAERGAIMASHGKTGGAMARVLGHLDEVRHLARRFGVDIACVNAPDEFVLAGAGADIDRIVAEGKAARLNVSHAFHSTHMQHATGPFAACLRAYDFIPPTGRVVSTITGDWLETQSNLRGLLVKQLTNPVCFADALAALAEETDLLIEVGPGSGLTRLALAQGHRCLPIDAGAASLQPLLSALAEAWRQGVRFDAEKLFSDRTVRPLSLTPPAFLTSPCGVTNNETSASPPKKLRAENLSVTPATVPESISDTLTVVRTVVAEELGLQIDAVASDARLLGDLHLNSLSVGRIVAAAAARLGMANPAAVTDLSGFTSAGLATHLTELRELAPDKLPESDRIEGVASWVAMFETIWQEASPVAASSDCVQWRLYGLSDAPAVPCAQNGTGALVNLIEDGAANGVATARALWSHVKAAQAAGIDHLAILHCHSGIEGFVRSLLAERLFDSVTTIDVANRDWDWVAIARLLAVPLRGYSAWRLETFGKVSRPALRRCLPPTANAGINAGDVALVIGGARGIGAECALRLASEHGVSLALVGRSPVTDPAVRETLDRAEALGVRALYRSIDASDAGALCETVGEFAAQDFAPTIALHAAGVNHPAVFGDLDLDDLNATLAPKLTALEALTTVLETHRVKLVMGFGSIIGALGLAGETHYALANGMMSNHLVEWGAASRTRVLSLDWSVWAGSGMGERLGAVERLRTEGVDAIPLESALAEFEALAADSTAHGRRIITSRFGPPSQVRFALAEAPPLRFIESPRTMTPEVELIADARLSRGADPWLDDHVVDGTAVVPGVILLEAAAQAAHTLTGKQIAGFEEVKFERPVIVINGALTLRTAALVHPNGVVEVVIRASDDDFSSDRARALVLTGNVTPDDLLPLEIASAGRWEAESLYGALFFNSGRFRRIVALEKVSAFTSRVALSSPEKSNWFSAYSPQFLVLGDPGARDAGLHALQSCVPQLRVIPVSVKHIAIFDAGAPRRTVEAKETWSDAENFCFDIVWRDASGNTVEFWQGAQFRAISPCSLECLPDWLLPAALERASALVSEHRNIRVGLVTGANKEERRTAAYTLLGMPAPVHRGDGAPEISGDHHLSISHGADSTLVATGKTALGVDLVEPSSSVRSALSERDLDLAGQIAVMHSCSREAAAATVWAAREALRKAGAPVAAPITTVESPYIGGTFLRSEGYQIVCLRHGTDGCVALASAPQFAAPKKPRQKIQPKRPIVKVRT